MSDIIRREDAYKVLTDYYHHRTDVQHNALREALNKIPSAEPERKTGKWIHDGSNWENRWLCSACGYKWFIRKGEAHYCPHCGADMRGDHE